MLAQFIARRAVDADNAGAVVAEIAQNAKVGDQPARGTARRAAGTRRRDGAGGAGPRLQARLKRAGGRTAALAAEVAQQFGDTEAVRRNLATVRNERAAADDRKRALQVLAGAAPDAARR